MALIGPIVSKKRRVRRFLYGSSILDFCREPKYPHFVMQGVIHYRESAFSFRGFFPEI
jgi:hypothetical protein